MRVPENLKENLLRWATQAAAQIDAQREFELAGKNLESLKNETNRIKVEIDKNPGVGPNLQRRYIQTQGKLFRIEYKCKFENGKRVNEEIEIELIQPESGDEK